MSYINNYYSLKSILISSITAAFLLTGCGSSDVENSTDFDNNANELSTEPLQETTTISGQLVDSYVQNADYLCGDGEEGITDVDGRFECNSLPVHFKIGSLKLGEISTMPEDNQVFPQDLVNVDRNNTRDPKVVAMARFLQSCDDDNNKENGLHIRQHVKDELIVDEYFDADSIENYVDITVDEDSALAHLMQTTDFTDAVHKAKLPPHVKDALLTPTLILTQDVKNTLAYMGNEERLAYDVYNKLAESFPDNMQFTNIASKGETPHIQTVQLLIKKYISDYSEFTNIDMDELGYKETAITDMQAGVYDISAIQNLYNTLIAKGETSAQDALEVGCMIEVTDIIDLDHDIALAEESNATDVQTAFEFLRDGSYSHYWAFDKGLVNMGITDGCCSLGVIDGVDYCHSEYPVNEHGLNDDSHSEENREKMPPNGENTPQDDMGEPKGHQYGRE